MKSNRNNSEGKKVHYYSVKDFSSFEGFNFYFLLKNITIVKKAFLGGKANVSRKSSLQMRREKLRSEFHLYGSVFTFNKNYLN